jgi:DNA polymerase III epsilon subunit-like protein
VNLTEALFLVIDTETTGPDPDRDHVIQLGGAMFDKCVLKARYTSLIRSPWVPLDAYRIHGISVVDVEKAKHFKEVYPRFEHQAGQAEVFVTFNGGRFDWPILQADCVRSDIDYKVLKAKPHVDVMHAARYHFRGLRKRDLLSCCVHMGVDLGHGQAHTAGADAERTGKLALAMIKAGLMPDEVDEAIAAGERWKAVRDAEFDEFSYWFYRDNQDGDLRVGAGKHTGQRPSEVPKKYWKSMLKYDDLPRFVRTLMETFS